MSDIEVMKNPVLDEVMRQNALILEMNMKILEIYLRPPLLVKEDCE